MYVKLFGQILKSSLMDESIQTRWAWVVLLASADQDGMVYGTIPALARIANLPVDEFTAAMDCLMAPDPNSTSRDEDGRRVLKIAPNQWLLVNYLKYREMKDTDKEREQTRIRVRNYRNRKDVTQCNVTVTDGNAQKRQAEAEAEAEAERSILSESHSGKPEVSTPARQVFAHWQEVHGYARAKLDDKRTNLINLRLRVYSVADLCKAIDGCKKDAFSMGDNDRRKPFNTIEIILRDAAHVDKFMATDDNPGAPQSKGDIAKEAERAFIAIREQCERFDGCRIDRDVVEAMVATCDPRTRFGMKGIATQPLDAFDAIRTSEGAEADSVRRRFLSAYQATPVEELD